MEYQIDSVEHGVPQCGISAEFWIPHKWKGFRNQAMHRYLWSQQHYVSELGIVGWDVPSIVIITLHLLWRVPITGDEFIKVTYLPLNLPWDDLCGTCADRPNEESESHTHIYVDNFEKWVHLNTNTWKNKIKNPSGFRRFQKSSNAQVSMITVAPCAWTGYCGVGCSFHCDNYAASAVKSKDYWRWIHWSHIPTFKLTLGRFVWNLCWQTEWREWTSHTYIRW